MARTESISIQVHPNDEQSQIDLMQTFHWSLLSSQEIKNIDNHLERRGDDIYQVTNSEHYVKLTFNRELDAPNLNEIRKLEQSFFSIQYPKYPKLFPVSFWLWLAFTFVYGIGLAGWLLYFFLYFQPKKAEADQKTAECAKARQEIIAEIAKYN